MEGLGGKGAKGDGDGRGMGAGSGAGAGQGAGSGGSGGSGGGEDSLLRLLVGAGAGVDVGTLPEAAPGVGGYVGLQYESLYLRLEGAWFAPQSVARGNGAGGASWRGTELAYGSLRGCWTPTLGPVLLGPCGGVGLGAFISELPTLDGTGAVASSTALLVAPRVGGVFIWPFVDVLALTLGADLAIHAHAPTLPDVAVPTDLHEVGRATFLGTVGLELRPRL